MKQSTAKQGAERARSTLASVVTHHRRSIEYLAVDTLKPSPHNVRTHPRKQIRQIAKSIKRFGFQSPIIINADNVILCGHGRVLAAKELGLAEVSCVRISDLSAAEERALALADNKIAEGAGTDRERLAFELTELSKLLGELEIPEDIEITGYSIGEIDNILQDFGDEHDDEGDELPSLAGATISSHGDIWKLGKHRVYCGDARDSSSYAALFGGTGLAEMAITDPPYNVPINGHVGGRGRVKHQEFAFASGEMSTAAFHEFLSDSIRCVRESCRAGALIYVFCDWGHVQQFCRVGEELGLRLVNICVWNKTTPGQGSFYRSAHEFVCVFEKPGGSRRNNIQLGRYGRSRTNVWTFAAPNKFAGKTDPVAQHPTPKPVPLVAEAIKDASAREGIILDAFLGSGTTLLAAEKVGRVAYAIEYEPRFVDLSVRRWQQATGRDAVLESTGQIFDDVAERGRISSTKPARRPRARTQGSST